MIPAEGLKTEPEKLRRQHELRKRREAIRRELEGKHALTDAQELELTREMRKIQADLKSMEESA